jgi:hypothetical protein
MKSKKIEPWASPWIWGDFMGTISMFYVLVGFNVIFIALCLWILGKIVIGRDF